MRRNGYGSAAAPTHHEMILQQQVTALQYEKSALSLELKSMREQQEAFLQEVESEIEAQKCAGLAAAETEIFQLRLQLQQAKDECRQSLDQMAQKLSSASDREKNLLSQASQNESRVAELNKQIRQATEALKAQEVFMSVLPRNQADALSGALERADKEIQTDYEILSGDSDASRDIAELKMRLASAVEANINCSRTNMQLRKELDEARSATRHADPKRWQASLNASSSAASSSASVESVVIESAAQQKASLNASSPAVSTPARVESVVIESSARHSSNDKTVLLSPQTAYDDTAALLSRIRIENFRDNILRNFCFRSETASMYRIFRQWRFFVKEKAHRILQTELERQLSELTHLHQIQQQQLETVQATETDTTLRASQCMTLLSSFWKKIGDSRICANSRRALQCMWKIWLKRIRIRRRIESYFWQKRKMLLEKSVKNWKKNSNVIRSKQWNNTCRKKIKQFFKATGNAGILVRCIIMWRRNIKHNRALCGFVERKKQNSKQKVISFWKHETLVCHIINQQFQVQQAAAKFVAMHEAQNGAVLEIKQTCSKIMADLEAVTLEKDKIQNLFLFCEEKLLALFYFHRSKSSCRSLFQTWKEEFTTSKKLNGFLKRARRNFAKKILLLWQFDCKMQSAQAFFEQEISQAFERIDLERQTMITEQQSMEDELEITSNRLDAALQEIEELVETNQMLSDELQTMESLDCEVQTDEHLWADSSSSKVKSNVQTQDNEAQTDAQSNV